MYTAINNFKFGVDSRRNKLASQPGSLLFGEDGHINQGGSFEQRNAFTRIGTWPANVFGLELTSNGLVVFGSVATPAGLPSGVSYIRCQHPSDTTKSMTAILTSCSFGGNAWCVAKFNNNDVFIYYNGVVVPACINGKVLTSATSNQAIATQLYNFLNTTYFSDIGVKATAPVANGSAYYIDIYGLLGVNLELTKPVITPASGSLGSQAIVTQLLSNGSAGTPATAGNFSFLCSMGATGSVASVKASSDNGATFGISLLSAPVTWVSGDTTGYTTAINLAAIISGTSSSLAATATAAQNKVTLAVDPRLGNAPNGYPVQIISTGDFCLDFLALDLSDVTSFTSTSIKAGSLQCVALNSTYGGGGSFTINNVPAGTYFYRKGLNGISVTAGALTYYADAEVVLAAPTNVTFTGGANMPVTEFFTKMVEILDGVSATTGTTVANFVANLAAKIRTFGAANKFTACQSSFNPNHLVISRTEIRSDYVFYPVISSDIDKAKGFNNDLVIAAPMSLQFTMVRTTNLAGYVNTSIVGGVSPYRWTIELISGSAQNIGLYLPNGSTDTSTATNAADVIPYVSYGSDIMLFGNPSGGGSTTITVRYRITITDATGFAVSKTLAFAYNQSANTLTLTVS